MKIFKLFYQLLKDNSTSIIWNVLLLLAIVIPVNALFNNSYTSQFEVAKSDIGIINYDEDDPVTQNLLNYLDKQLKVVPVSNTPEEIADALYYQNADYILSIPEGFGESVIDSTKEDIPLEKTVTQSLENEAFVDILINTYLTNLQLLSSQITDFTDSNQLTSALADLNQQADQSNVEIIPAETNANVSLLAFGTNYAYFISYIMITTFITTFGYAILAMRNPEIMKRDRMGMVTESQRWVQILLGCITFSIVFWSLLMVGAIVLYGVETIFSQKGLLLALNSFIAMFGIQAMAYFCVTIANSKGAISFLSTTVSLVLAFASGIFVPRAFVSPLMQQIASFATPIWQVKGTEIVLDSTTLSLESIQPFYTMLGTQILIGFAFYAISFVIQKYRQQNSIY